MVDGKEKMSTEKTKKSSDLQGVNDPGFPSMVH